MTRSRNKTVVVVVVLAAAAVVLAATPAVAQTAPPADPSAAVDSWFGGDGLSTTGYDIGYAPPGWNDFNAKIGGWLLDVTFALIKTMASATVAVLAWGFSAQLADAVAGIIDPTATRFHIALFGSDLGLYDSALFLAVWLTGMQALRGRLAQAAGELAMTWLVAVVYFAAFAFVPGSFSGAVDGMRSVTSNLSTTMVAATMGTPASCDDVDDPDAAPVMCPMRAAFHKAFVVGPYDQLNWGRDLGSASDRDNAAAACAAARDDLVASGPHGTDEQPRTAMTGAGCDAAATYQATVTAERVLLGFVVATTQSLLLLVVMFIGFSLMMLQLGMSISVMLLPFAVLGGLVPGPSRALLWRWMGWAAKLVLGVVAMALLLAIYLVVITETLAATQGLAMGMRFMSLVTPTVALLWARRRMAKAAKATGQQVGMSLDRATPGRAANGTIGQAAGAFAAPTYRGLSPKAYANPNTRAAVRDAASVVARLASRRRSARALRGTP